MSSIIPCRGITPVLGEDCFIASNASIIGEVVAGDQCSFWFQSVIRGDVASIHMGNQVNVQDGAVIHGTYGKASTSIGDRVSIGHRAIVHGCTLEDDVLVGMGAIVMDNAHVGRACLIAAGAVVLQNTRLEPGCLYAGVPAKKIKELDPEQFAAENQRIANNYVLYSSWFKDI